MGRKNVKKPNEKLSPLQEIKPNNNNNNAHLTTPYVQKSQVTGSLIGRLCAFMFEKDDASILAVFRIFWGSTMMMEIAEHIIEDYAKTKSSFYTNMSFQNKYWGFEWVPVIDLMYMKIFLWVLLGIALCVTIGFFYRLCSFLFLLGFTYIVTIEAGNYLNHFYLIQIMATYMIFLPCNCIFSVDCIIDPSIKSKTSPKWALFSIRAILFIVYTYAGIVKINIDWLRGEPLRHWLAKRMGYPYIGWLLRYDPIIYFFSYSGLIYDLVVGMLLIFDRTLWIGVAASLFFHGSNRYIFNIGIFPILCVASTTIFFNSDWPLAFYYKVTCFLTRKQNNYKRFRSVKFGEVSSRNLTFKEIIILCIVFGSIVFQVLLPLRHFTYEGDVVWTEHGHRYSWRMKLRDKQCFPMYYAYLPENQEWFEIPMSKIITPRQLERISVRPEFMIQVVNFIAERLQTSNKLKNPPEIYVYNVCSLNYRKPAVMIDGHTNLAGLDVWDWPYPWIVPLPPLSEEEASFLPWNWEWNFNWIFKKWESNVPMLKKMQQELQVEIESILASLETDFLKFISEKHFHNDTKLALSRCSTSPETRENRKKMHDKASQGLRINFANDHWGF